MENNNMENNNMENNSAKFTDNFLESECSLSSTSSLSDSSITSSLSNSNIKSNLSESKCSEYSEYSECSDLSELVSKYSVYDKCEKLNFTKNEMDVYNNEIDRERIINKIVNSRGIIYEKDLKCLDYKDKEIIELKKIIKKLEKERIELIINFNEKIDQVRFENKSEMIKLKRKILQKDVTN